MNDVDIRSYLEVLELPADATLADVKTAYQQLKDIYSTNSIALSSIEDEFPESSRQKILQQLEEVYKKLLSHFGAGDRSVEDGQGAPSGNVTPRLSLQEVTSYTGPTLKQIREMRGIDLYEVSQATKIRKGYLQDIETENFPSLPSEIYLKGYVVNYAQYLSLDSKKVAEDYMGRFREWQSRSRKFF